MMISQKTIQLTTAGRGATNITQKINQQILSTPIQNGICQIFVKHTSASLIISENADPDVLQDLEYFLSKWVKDGDPNYRHDSEGEDDMAAHIRSVLTQTSISVPITNQKLNMGIWQAVYLYEHRYQPHQRQIVLSFLGE